MKRFPPILLCSSGFVLFVCQVAMAARLLDVYIKQDDSVVVHSYYDDNGRANPATMWRYLKHAPIMVDREATTVKAIAASPLEAKLTGDIVIGIQHVNRIIAQARLSILSLRRIDEQTQGWFLPETEVERTAVVAGLGVAGTPPNGEPSLRALPAMVAISMLALIGLTFAVGFLVAHRRRAKCQI